MTNSMESKRGGKKRNDSLYMFETSAQRFLRRYWYCADTFAHVSMHASKKQYEHGETLRDLVKRDISQKTSTTYPGVLPSSELDKASSGSSCCTPCASGFCTASGSSCTSIGTSRGTSIGPGESLAFGSGSRDPQGRRPKSNRRRAGPQGTSEILPGPRMHKKRTNGMIARFAAISYERPVQTTPKIPGSKSNKKTQHLALKDFLSTGKQQNMTGHTIASSAAALRRTQEIAGGVMRGNRGPNSSILYFLI